MELRTEHNGYSQYDRIWQFPIFLPDFQKLHQYDSGRIPETVVRERGTGMRKRDGKGMDMPLPSLFVECVKMSKNRLFSIES